MLQTTISIKVVDVGMVSAEGRAGRLQSADRAAGGGRIEKSVRQKMAAVENSPDSFFPSLASSRVEGSSVAIFPLEVERARAQTGSLGLYWARSGSFGLAQARSGSNARSGPGLIVCLILNEI